MTMNSELLVVSPSIVEINSADLDAIEKLNNTEAPFSREACIHQLFEARVRMNPDVIAAKFGSQILTYRELNEKANRLCQYLIASEIKVGDLVGIYLERSLEMVVSILGVLKAGAAYVPLDPDYPSARIDYMLKDANVRIILTKKYLEEKICNSDVEFFSLDCQSNKSVLDKYDDKPIDLNDIKIEAFDIAYVIYTSGSTGNPKGVAVEHNALVNRIEWMYKKYECDSTDVILQKTPFSFDVSIWEFFLPLISGATIVFAKPGGHKDPIYLSELIKNEGVTKLHFVPSMLNAMLSAVNLADCTSIKDVFCSGEALLPHHVDTFYKQHIPAKLHNLYGPTEAAIDVSYWECSAADAARNSVPIGKPIDNLKLYIVDESCRRVPIGVCGELLIGGVGLAKCYLNRPELTAEKFIANPFSTDDGSRLYKTGDLCRYLSDGNIEFVGRIDHQVKIRGYRIELGEIENTLLNHELIEEAAVLVKETPAGINYLVAYVVSESELSNSILAEYLGGLLPEHMVPSVFEMLPEMPLTPSGKIDRIALSAATQSRFNANLNLLEMSALEIGIYTIWQKILGFDDIGLDDDLFRIGGDSIAAVQVFSAINKEFGVNIYVEELFSSEHFSIRWLSSLVQKHQIEILGQDEYLALLAEVDDMTEEEVARILLN